MENLSIIKTYIIEYLYVLYDIVSLKFLSPILFLLLTDFKV